uniref:HypC/HybG/HupF family hydrogenase formation chaperone n=1 Tax=Desulfatirhabdium butyrativorans TaxID=340467 RepID=A0A7C4MTE6_9BACT
MCLAIPSKIVDIQDQMAIIDVEGVRRSASLLLLEDAAIGDYVIVHAGFAIHKIDPETARESIDLLRESMSRMEETDPQAQTGLNLNRRMADPQLT